MTGNLELLAIDESILHRLLAAAIAGARPQEVMPPVPGLDQWTPAHKQAFRAFHRDRRPGLDGTLAEATFAVQIDDEVVGSARLAATEARGCLEIGLWLARSHRGRGVATAVLPLLLDEARRVGATSVVAETTEDNVAAVATLRHHGAQLTVDADSGRVQAELKLSLDARRTSSRGSERARSPRRPLGRPGRPPAGHRSVISLGTDDTSILTERLTLTGLTIDDANEMVSVLDDDRLYEFTGGRPATLDELRDRYRRFVAGPKGSSEVWLNWIVCSRQAEVAVGTMQATISTTPDGRSSADVAWVIGVAWQGQGFASEAALSLIDWLHGHGVDDVTAHIHPDHRASGIVASRAGLHPTDEQHNRETVWRDKAK